MNSTRSGSVVFLVDTNVLIYTHDPRDRERQERARQVLRRIVSRREAVLSVQCLTEFFNVLTRGLPERLPLSTALEQTVRLSRFCFVLQLTPAAVLEACRAATVHSISIWDAQIWAVARLNGIPYVLSEDWQDGRELDGVRFLNPFAPGFDVGLLDLD